MELMGKQLLFLAEYDALPGMGHACGHNIIGTSSVGAGIILKEIMKKHNIEGTVKVFWDTCRRKSRWKNNYD